MVLASFSAYPLPMLPPRLSLSANISPTPPSKFSRNGPPVEHENRSEDNRAHRVVFFDFANETCRERLLFFAVGESI